MMSTSNSILAVTTNTLHFMLTYTRLFMISLSLVLLDDESFVVHHIDETGEMKSVSHFNCATRQQRNSRRTKSKRTFEIM